MRRKWVEWLADGECEYTRSGNRRSASYTQVAEWVSQCWKDLDKDLIKRSFVGCGIIPSSSGSGVELHSRLRKILGLGGTYDAEESSGEEGSETTTDDEEGTDDEGKEREEDDEVSSADESEEN